MTLCNFLHRQKSRLVQFSYVSYTSSFKMSSICVHYFSVPKINWPILDFLIHDKFTNTEIHKH
jgi:hypothetical protein